MAENSAIDEAKDQLRTKAHQQRGEVGSQAREEAAQAAAQHFFAQVPITKSQVIGAYWPIRDEIDIKPVLSRLVDEGYQVALPVTGGAEDALIFRRWQLGAALYEAGFGTLAPADGAEVVTPELLIIPLLGFDKTGTRLGYGKGHYDRTIAAMDKKPMVVGYAFSAQELAQIPRDVHDVPMDVLITEEGALRFQG